MFCFESQTPFEGFEGKADDIEEAFRRGAQIVDFLGTFILWRQESKPLVPEKKSWDL